MNDQRLRDDLADGHTRVQTRIGILENELHVVTHALQVLLVHGGDVLTIEEDLATRGVREAHDAAASRGLTAAGLTNEAEGLAGKDVEADVVDRLNALLLLGEDAGVDGELLGKVLDVKQGLSHPKPRLPSCGS